MANKWYGTAAGLTDAQAKILDDLYNEKRQVIKDNGHKRILISSAAGSGKTTTLVAKYIYLTKVKGVNPNKIHILSYSNRCVKTVKDKLKEIGFDPDEVENVVTTFHSLALKVMHKQNEIWPELIEAIKRPFNDEEIDHSRAEVFMNKLGDPLRTIIKEDKRFERNVINECRRIKGHRPHKYVCLREDCNGIPGSCRSEKEKKIFELLATNNVKFAYEEPDRTTRCRPDFTIYLPGEQMLFCEYYSTESSSDKYKEAERIKEEKLRRQYGNYFLPLTGDKWETTLVEKLESLGIEITDGDPEGGQIEPDKLLRLIVQLYVDVRESILESCVDLHAIPEKMKVRKDDVGFFFRNIWPRMEELYSKYLNDNKLLYTDFADSIKQAVRICNAPNDAVREVFSYDYILVDEYQDISLLRYKFLESLCNLSQNCTLIAVGDDRQSIYGFANGDITLFQNFEDKWNSKKVKRYGMTLQNRFGNPLALTADTFIQKDSTLSKNISPAEHSTRLYFVEFDKEQFKQRFKWIDNKIRNIQNTNDAKGRSFMVLSRFNETVRNYEKGLQLNHVRAMTMHKAKGEEADYVFVLDCNEGSIPYIKKSGTNISDKILAVIRDETIQKREMEERRLFFVAMTRAKKELYILYRKGEESEYVEELKKIMKAKRLEYKEVTA